ncbi:MAG: PHP domain-containing protein [Candidatus Micrarchaeota archaeon]|nr:PHP domain-containing protein [Candidatus Micrarchaeota archaeon]
MIGKKGKQKAFRADLHMHTCHSIDSLSRVEDVLAAAVKAGLNAIAITDHNETEGAFEAQKIAKAHKLPLQIIIGEEVMCKEGDLLVYFLKRRIAPGPLAQVLKEVKRQGAVCSSAHPYDFTRGGIPLDNLPASILKQIDCIETFNCRAMLKGMNEKAAAAAVRFNKPQLAGTDSHHPSELGGAYVEFSGISALTPSTLLTALRKIIGKVAPTHVKIFTRYAVLRNRLAGRKKKVD